VSVLDPSKTIIAHFPGKARTFFLKSFRRGKEIWGVRLHELRHTYASILIQERGVDIGRVMKRMGHSSIMTTQGYFHQFNP